MTVAICSYVTGVGRYIQRLDRRQGQMCISSSLYLTLRHVVTDLTTDDDITLNDGSPLLANNVWVRIYDYDTAGVIIRGVGGVTATMEMSESDKTW